MSLRQWPYSALFCVFLFAHRPAFGSAAALTVNASTVAVPAVADPVGVTIDAPSTLLTGAKTGHVVRSGPKLETEAERNTECENGTLHGKPCRVSWPRVLGSSLIFLSSQHGGNIWMDKDTRINLTHGSYWGDYAYCVEHYRWSRWKDDDPFGVDYIGHPMMGAVTNSIYEQNDPKQRALSFENTHRYWFGRLRATAYSAAYSAQWKIGPASEASIGNTGIGYYVRARDGVYTNETGMQDFFITPIGGLAWNVGEDLLARYLFSRIAHAHPRNRWILIPAGIITPTRAAANVSRFRAFYYRDEDTRDLYRQRSTAETR